ncbi:MAG: response regulator [Candidatus Rokubacteria bacterium]|nr:response regulator [Candidatus Rokubacteria bacterium]
MDIPNGERRRVMVVDQAGPARTAVAADLAARGFEVVLAVDGADALSQWMARRADVVIIDVAGPGLPGIEAASVLKWLDPAVDVILTASPDAPASGERRHVDRFRCFEKPLDLDQLARAMRRESTSHEVQP